MDSNATAALQMDGQDIQNMVSQVYAEALKSLPKGQVPSWLESTANFIQLHPWISLSIFLGIVLIISAVVREILCVYFKTNEIVVRLKRLEERIK